MIEEGLDSCKCGRVLERILLVLKWNVPILDEWIIPIEARLYFFDEHLIVCFLRPGPATFDEISISSMLEVSPFLIVNEIRPKWLNAKYLKEHRKNPHANYTLIKLITLEMSNTLWNDWSDNTSPLLFNRIDIIYLWTPRLKRHWDLNIIINISASIVQPSLHMTGRSNSSFVVLSDQFDDKSLSEIVHTMNSESSEIDSPR